MIIENYKSSANIFWIEENNFKELSDTEGVIGHFLLTTGKCKSSIVKSFFLFDVKLRGVSNNLYSWVVFQDPIIQKKTRILMYKKLWKALDFTSIDLSKLYKTNECCEEFPSGVKFRGGVLLEDISPLVLRQIMHSKWDFVFVYLEGGVDFDSIVKNDWNSFSEYNKEFIESVVEKNGVVIYTVGEFDDRECGISIFSKPGLLEKVFSDSSNTM